MCIRDSTYYDPKEQKDLIGNFNVRVLDPTYQTISKVVVGADNTIPVSYTHLDVYKRQV